MSEGVMEWKEQLLSELSDYQKKEAEQVERLLRLNEIEGLLEEGKAMWKFLFSGTQEPDFEQNATVLQLQEEYRTIKLEADRYNRYFLENSLEKDYLEGLRKQDVTGLSAVQKEGHHKADYALSYFLLCVKNNRKGVEYLQGIANLGDAYAMLRLGEYYEYRAVNEIGEKSCNESIKECKKWYTNAENADSKMQGLCQEGKQRITLIETEHMDHSKQIKKARTVLKTIKISTIIVPILLCFFIVLWAGLQASHYINTGSGYSVDGKIYVSSTQGDVPEKIFGIKTYVIDKSVSELTIPEGTKIIPKDAYSSCPNLKKVVIPEGVVRIEKRAFSDCGALSDITFPSTLEYIGEEAFSRCTSIKKIEAANTSLKKLESRAFSGCTILKKMTLPNSCMIKGSYEGCEIIYGAE